MLANATDNIVVGIGGAVFVIIGAAIVRWRIRIAPYLQTNWLFDTPAKVADFLRFWGYCAIIMGTIAFVSVCVLIGRRT